MDYGYTEADCSATSKAVDAPTLGTSYPTSFDNMLARIERELADEQLFDWRNAVLTYAAKLVGGDNTHAITFTNALAWFTAEA